MSHEVEVKESAENEIKKLDGSKKNEIIKQLEKLEKFPKNMANL